MVRQTSYRYIAPKQDVRLGRMSTKSVWAHPKRQISATTLARETSYGGRSAMPRGNAGMWPGRSCEQSSKHSAPHLWLGLFLESRSTLCLFSLQSMGREERRRLAAKKQTL